MSKATSQAFSSYRQNRTVLSFRERHRLTVFVSNGTVAVMAQRGVSLKSVLTCYEKNKMIFFFIWAVIDFMTINISWFLLNIVLTCYEKNKMIFFFIWAVIDFMTINISWFLLNIKQHPSPISRKPQTVLNGWMAWIVCIVLFSYHKCACPMSRAIAATFWPRGRRALCARRPRGPNVKKNIVQESYESFWKHSVLNMGNFIIQYHKYYMKLVIFNMLLTCFKLKKVLLPNFT